jgi:hypothetical protein
MTPPQADGVFKNHNKKLGQLFNMSCSAISHCVKIFKDKMNRDKKVKNQFEKLNSQFKLCHLHFKL